MFTPPAPSTPLSAGTPTVRPAPAGQETDGTPRPCRSGDRRYAPPLPVRRPTVPDPAPAGQETDGTRPRPIQQGAGAISATPAPWQRVDALWPVVTDSPTKLDGDCQRLVRSLLTQAVGKRLQRRRQADDTLLRLWEPNPYLAEYVRLGRFYAPGLVRFRPPDLYHLLLNEAGLMLEVLETQPGVLGVEVWQELVELQCRRIGQVYAALQCLLGRTQALDALQRLLEGLT